MAPAAEARCHCSCHGKVSVNDGFIGSRGVDYCDPIETAVACALCFATHIQARENARRHPGPGA